LQNAELVLSYPQWQGSGRFGNLRRGAQAAAEVCGQFGPVVVIPDAGEGEAKGGVNRWTAILGQFRSAQKLLTEIRPRTLLTAGGDCACDIAVIDYLHGIYPDLTVIWVDAHLDANTAATSPSGNFHGMPVSSIMGSAPEDLQPLLSAPLAPSQFRYVSAHVGDPGDWDFQREHGLSWLEPDEKLTGPVHIHFDLDSLNPAEFPYLAYPEGTLAIDAGLALVRKMAVEAQLVGLTITEFAPADSAGARDGGDVLLQLCEAAYPR
jgi:arginase